MSAGEKAPSWTIEELTKLETDWNEGITTALIAAGIGRSKNSIVGKAHRLGLTPRPNPIRKQELTDQQREARDAAREAKRKPLKVAEPKPLPELPPIAEVAERKPPKHEAKPMPTARVYAFKATRTCQWIEADPAAGPWSYCGKPCVPEAEDKAMPSPYCAEHHRRAYVRVTDHARRAQERQLPAVRPE